MMKKSPLVDELKNDFLLNEILERVNYRKKAEN